MINERELSDAEKAKRDEIVDSMDEADFKKRYGDKWKEVMYATATKNAKRCAEGLNEGTTDRRELFNRAFNELNKLHIPSYVRDTFIEKLTNVQKAHLASDTMTLTTALKNAISDIEGDRTNPFWQCATVFNNLILWLRKGWGTGDLNESSESNGMLAEIDIVISNATQAMLDLLRDGLTPDTYRKYMDIIASIRKNHATKETYIDHQKVINAIKSEIDKANETLPAAGEGRYSHEEAHAVNVLDNMMQAISRAFIRMNFKYNSLKIDEDILNEKTTTTRDGRPLAATYATVEMTDGTQKRGWVGRDGVLLSTPQRAVLRDNTRKFDTKNTERALRKRFPLYDTAGFEFIQVEMDVDGVIQPIRSSNPGASIFIYGDMGQPNVSESKLNENDMLMSRPHVEAAFDKCLAKLNDMKQNGPYAGHYYDDFIRRIYQVNEMVHNGIFSDYQDVLKRIGMKFGYSDGVPDDIMDGRRDPEEDGWFPIVQLIADIKNDHGAINENESASGTITEADLDWIGEIFNDAIIELDDLYSVDINNTSYSWFHDAINLVHQQTKTGETFESLKKAVQEDIIDTSIEYEMTGEGDDACRDVAEKIIKSIDMKRSVIFESANGNGPVTESDLDWINESFDDAIIELDDLYGDNIHDPSYSWFHDAIESVKSKVVVGMDMLALKLLIRQDIIDASNQYELTGEASDECREVAEKLIKSLDAGRSVIFESAKLNEWYGRGEPGTLENMSLDGNFVPYASLHTNPNNSGGADELSRRKLEVRRHGRTDARTKDGKRMDKWRIVWRNGPKQGHYHPIGLYFFYNPDHDIFTLHDAIGRIIKSFRTQDEVLDAAWTRIKQEEKLSGRFTESTVPLNTDNDGGRNMLKESQLNEIKIGTHVETDKAPGKYVGLVTQINEGTATVKLADNMIVESPTAVIGLHNLKPFAPMKNTITEEEPVTETFAFEKGAKVCSKRNPMLLLGTIWESKGKHATVNLTNELATACESLTKDFPVDTLQLFEGESVDINKAIAEGSQKTVTWDGSNIEKIRHLIQSKGTKNWGISCNIDPASNNLILSKSVGYPIGSDIDLEEPLNHAKGYNESVEASGPMKSYLCIHNKRGREQVIAESTFDAARKAMKKWQLTEMNGIDVFELAGKPLLEYSDDPDWQEAYEAIARKEERSKGYIMNNANVYQGYYRDAIAEQIEQGFFDGDEGWDTIETLISKDNVFRLVGGVDDEESYVRWAEDQKYSDWQDLSTGNLEHLLDEEACRMFMQSAGYDDIEVNRKPWVYRV